MTSRQVEARNAALQATKLASQLLALSELEKWHDVRLNETDGTLEHLYSTVADLLEIDSASDEDDFCDDDFDIVVTQPVTPAKPLSTTVFVPFDQDKKVNGFVHWFGIIGFVGGMQSNGFKRPNEKRAIPRSVITSPPNNGVVGVQREWLYKPENVDLLNHVMIFPASVTKL